MKRFVSGLCALFGVVVFAALVASVVLAAWNEGLAADGLRFVQLVCAQAAKTQFGPALLAACGGLAWGVAALVLLLALAWFCGPVYCRRLCPLGLAQAAVRFVFRKKCRRVCTRLPQSDGQRCLRLAVFAAVVLAGAFGAGVAWLDPYAIFLRAVRCASAPASFLAAAGWAGVAFALGLAALVLVLAACGQGRIWCTWICPVGSLLDVVARRGRGKDAFDAAAGCDACRLCLRRPVADKVQSPCSTRRDFLAGSSAAVAAVSSAKFGDGGLAPVALAAAPARAHAVLPPGAESDRAFARRCVGCQLCVAACPEKVLRPAAPGGRFLLPAMGFAQGWCRPECTACGAACPTGAIKPLTPEEKAHVHVGRAVWRKDVCLAAAGVDACRACANVCPRKAIYMVPSGAQNPKAPLVPFVDAAACIGCGACEHVCPARPQAAIVVEGLAEQRAVVRRTEADAVAEAKKIVREGRACVVVVKGGVIVAHASGRGVAPLLDLFDEDVRQLEGAVVVDKVIGRAAAAVCVSARVARVEALVLAADARDFLAKRNVPAAGDDVVPHILDRARKNLCPLEQAVKKLDDPAKMLAALRRKLAQLRKK